VGIGGRLDNQAGEFSGGNGVHRRHDKQTIGDTTTDDKGIGSAWLGLERMAIVAVAIRIRDHGHAHGSRRSELTDYLGENPGGNLGTAQANPCCWLTPIGS